MKTNRFQFQADCLTFALDGAIAKAGPMKGPKFRMIPRNGGFQIQEQSISTNGEWAWYDDFFTTDKKWATQKLAQRLAS